MRYVLDASVAFKWAVPEIDSDKANRLRDAYRQAIHELLTPDIFVAELGHALTRAERRGRILELIRTLQPHFPFVVPLVSLL